MLRLQALGAQEQKENKFSIESRGARWNQFYGFRLLSLSDASPALEEQVMRRFHFNVMDGSRLVTHEVEELLSPVAARRFAYGIIEEMVEAYRMRTRDWENWKVLVTDEKSSFTFEIPFETEAKVAPTSPSQLRVS
jgi:hypothetical protein